ncbi:MAG: ketoacyl-ACP synthase III [bacterium]|nr:ketoacyl-ACP synthase III [bacterium]
MRNAVISAVGMHVPERVVANSYFDRILGEDVSTWLEQNVEIFERRWCAAGESTADLIVGAAGKILSSADVRASELDLIIISTDTPEYVSPSTASVVQDRLGATGAGSFDVNTACAGFVTALDMGAKYIRSDGKYNKVLVIGAYAMSKWLNLQDKKTVTLFADGAAGVLLQAEEGERGWLSASLYTEGQYNSWMGIYGGAAHMPTTPEVVAANDHQLKFVRKFPPELNPEIWTKMITEVVTEAGYGVQDIAMAFITQININSIRETMNKLDLPMERTQTVMHRYGYTGSACIPMAMCRAVEQGKLKRDDLVVFMGSGGGLSFAAAAFKW